MGAITLRLGDPVPSRQFTLGLGKEAQGSLAFGKGAKEPRRKEMSMTPLPESGAGCP